MHNRERDNYYSSGSSDSGIHSDGSNISLEDSTHIFPKPLPNCDSESAPVEFEEKQNITIAVDLRNGSPLLVISGRRDKTRFGTAQGDHVTAYVAILDAFSTLIEGYYDICKDNVIRFCKISLGDDTIKKLQDEEPNVHGKGEREKAVRCCDDPSLKAVVDREMYLYKVIVRSHYIAKIVDTFLEEVQKETLSTQFAVGREKKKKSQNEKGERSASNGILALNLIHCYSKDVSRVRRDCMQLIESLSDSKTDAYDTKRWMRYGMGELLGSANNGNNKAKELIALLKKEEYQEATELFSGIQGEIILESVAYCIYGLFDYERVLEFNWKTIVQARLKQKKKKTQSVLKKEFLEELEDNFQNSSVQEKGDKFYVTRGSLQDLNAVLDRHWRVINAVCNDLEESFLSSAYRVFIEEGVLEGAGWGEVARLYKRDGAKHTWGEMLTHEEWARKKLKELVSVENPPPDQAEVAAESIHHLFNYNALPKQKQGQNGTVQALNQSLNGYWNELRKDYMIDDGFMCSAYRIFIEKGVLKDAVWNTKFCLGDKDIDDKYTWGEIVTKSKHPSGSRERGVAGVPAALQRVIAKHKKDD